jgi:hypothetical protein
MKTIEQQIDRKNAINYIEAQIFSVMPYPVDSKHQGQICLKMQSEHGSSNWLNISPADCLAIEQILLASYLKKEAAE